MTAFVNKSIAVSCEEKEKKINRKNTEISKKRKNPKQNKMKTKLFSNTLPLFYLAINHITLAVCFPFANNPSILTHTRCSTNTTSVFAKNELFAKAMGKCYQRSPLQHLNHSIEQENLLYTVMYWFERAIKVEVSVNQSKNSIGLPELFESNSTSRTFRSVHLNYQTPTSLFCPMTFVVPFLMISEDFQVH